MGDAREEAGKQLFTREQYLVWKTVLLGTPWWLAKEAVATTAIEHPEWDLAETKTWAEWDKSA